MAKSVKFLNGKYLDSSSVNHKRKKLSELLEIKKGIITAKTGCIINAQELSQFINFVVLNLTVTTNTTGGWQDLGQLPKGYYPTIEIYTMGMSNSGVAVSIRITTDGLISIYTPTVIESNKIRFNMSYLST